MGKRFSRPRVVFTRVPSPVSPPQMGSGSSLLTFVSPCTMSSMEGRRQPEAPTHRAAMVAICFTVEVTCGGLRRLSQMAMAFPCLMSGSAQSRRLKGVKSTFKETALRPLIISSSSMPKLNTSALVLMWEGFSCSRSMKSSRPTENRAAPSSVSTSGMEDRLLDLRGGSDS